MMESQVEKDLWADVEAGVREVQAMTSNFSSNTVKRFDLTKRAAEVTTLLLSLKLFHKRSADIKNAWDSMTHNTLDPWINFRFDLLQYNYTFEEVDSLLENNDE